MANDQINLPAGFGGITRFNDEYESQLNLKPIHVMVFVALIAVFRIFLGLYF